MTALREIFARFEIEVDPEGNLQEGEHRTDLLTRSLNRLGIDTNTTRGRMVEMALRTGDMAGALEAASPVAGAAASAIQRTASAAFDAGRAIVEMTLALAEQNAELSLQARRLGVNTDQMQALGLLAADAGQDLDGVTDAMSTLQERARDAVIDPNSDPAEQLRRLGVAIPQSVDDLPDALTLLSQVSDGLAGMGNQTDRVGASMTLFGDVGRELLPVLQQGSGAIEAYRTELERLGGGASEESIQSSIELARAQARFDLALTSLKDRVLGPLIPVLADFAEGLAEVFAWLSRNRPALIGIRDALLAMVQTVITSILPGVRGMIEGIQTAVSWLWRMRTGLGALMESLGEISFDGVTAKINAFFEGIQRRYNQFASFLGLPTVGSITTPTGAPGSEPSAQAPAPSDQGFLSRLGRAADITDLASPGGIVRAGASQVVQTISMQIDGSRDPQAVAREVERVLDRQNRDAAEALAQ